MPSIIKRMLKQRAAYWAPTGESDVTSQPILADPVVVKCRWEDKSEQFINAAGTLNISNAKVYVDLNLEVNGFLVLLYDGLRVPKTVTNEQLLETLEYRDDPVKCGAWQIMKFEKTPDLRAKEFIRLAIL